MAVVEKSVLKGYFEPAKVPTESNYEDLIDSLADYTSVEDRLTAYLYSDGIDEHFDSETMPTGWTLRSTASHVASFGVYPSFVKISGSIGLAYLYRTLSTSYTHYVASICPYNISVQAYHGIRLELSSDPDNYFIQLCVRLYGSSYQWQIFMQHRSGSGDTVHEVTGGYLYGHPGPVIMDMGISGTRWSSWGANGYLRSIGSPVWSWNPNSGISGLSWTPDRMGIVLYNASATYEALYSDFFKW